MAGNYNIDFYDDQRNGSARSAAIVLPMVFKVLQPQTVCDIGCGVGTWLAEARRQGASVTVGVDGEWVRNNKLADPEVDIRPVNLEEPLNLGRTFDLAMCLEVAEHLTISRAETLVRDLCGLADHVLFGAAIPGQGGEHHINEQWQSWWRDRFAANGFTPLDVVRPAVWDNPDVEWWYRQNMLLYVRNDLAPAVAARMGGASSPLMLDVVHPALYAMNSGSPGFTTMLRALPKAFAQAVRRRAA